MRTVCVIIIACWSLVSVSFAGNGTSSRELVNRPTPQSDFRLAIKPGLILAAQSESFLTAPKRPQGSGQKSISKAVLLSAAVPGAGQFYVGSRLKGLAFLVIEAASLTGHFYYQNRGRDLESEFERYADQNWVEDDYWDWLSRESGISRDDMDALREYEHANFSHFLPEEKNQQYYENIGKYDQFNVGWIDTPNGRARDSALRENYTFMRKRANDNFKRATTLVTVALFNHLISALEAGLSTRRHNQTAGLQTNFRMQGMYYNAQLIPTFTFGVTW